MLFVLASIQALVDNEYSVSVRAVKLKRKVEMYQWTEESRTEEHKEPDGTIRTETHYSYSMCMWCVCVRACYRSACTAAQKWSGHLVSSSSFDDVRYQNPR